MDVLLVIPWVALWLSAETRRQSAREWEQYYRDKANDYRELYRKAIRCR